MIHSRLLPVLTLTALLLTGTFLAGCSDTDDTPAPQVDTGPVTTSYIQMAPMAPPQPQEEIAPLPDNVRAEIWRPGYWSYNGAGFEWVAGQMIARPSPTAIWSPDHWIEHTYGWAFIPGYWQ